MVWFTDYKKEQILRFIKIKKMRKISFDSEQDPGSNKDRAQLDDKLL